MGNWGDTFRQLFKRLLPSPVERPPEVQRRVDAASARLALYHFRGCPYCTTVSRTIHRLALKIEMRDTGASRIGRANCCVKGVRIRCPVCV